MSTKKEISNAAAALGRKGGSAKSEAKTTTARANGAKGGRPALVTYQHPDGGILIGHLAGRCFAAYRSQPLNKLECFAMAVDPAKIEEIADAWYDDDAPLASLQQSGGMMEWINDQMITGAHPRTGCAAPSFVAAARQYCA